MVAKGPVTYTFTYTDCEGNTHDWVYTYTIERLPFADPTDAGSTVACAALASYPAPAYGNRQLRQHHSLLLDLLWAVLMWIAKEP